MSNLDKLISELYQKNISNAECQEASRVLTGYFGLLYKIYQRAEQEKLDKEKQSNNNVKMIYENNRSTN